MSSQAARLSRLHIFIIQVHIPKPSSFLALRRRLTHAAVAQATILRLNRRLPRHKRRERSSLTSTHDANPTSTTCVATSLSTINEDSFVLSNGTSSFVPNMDDSIVSPSPSLPQSTQRSASSASVDDPLSLRPVFTSDEIDSIMSSTDDSPDSFYNKEIEDRLYPITSDDIKRQLEAIRLKRLNPSQSEILSTFNLRPDEAYLLEAPANIDDEQLWLTWFSDTLDKCEEARRASRDFRTDTKKPVATIGWASPNPFAVLEADDDVDSILSTEDADSRAAWSPDPSDIDEDDDAPSNDDDTPWSTEAVIDEAESRPTPSLWDEMPEDYPFFRRDDDYEALDEVLRTQRQTKNFHRRMCQLDPLYHDDIFLHGAPDKRFIGRLQTLNSKHSDDPYIDGYINDLLAAILADSGATGSFISEGFWRRIMGPTHPSFVAGNPGFVTANDQRLDILGRQVFTFTLAGRTIQYPFWIMSSVITDCIMGLDLLRRLGAIINFKTNTLTIEGGHHVMSLVNLNIEDANKHPCGYTLVQQDTVLQPMTIGHVNCVVDTTFHRNTTILVEPLKKTPIGLVATALYETRTKAIPVEIINPTTEPLRLLKNTPFGSMDGAAQGLHRTESRQTP